MTKRLRTMMSVMRLLGFGLIVVLAAGVGCTKDDRCFVEGTVTRDGKPFAFAQIIFADEAKGISGSAELSETGTYKVAGAFKPGKYVVTFAPPAAPPPLPLPDTPPPKKLVGPPIPAKYLSAAKSPLNTELKTGANRFDAELKGGD